MIRVSAVLAICLVLALGINATQADEGLTAFKDAATLQNNGLFDIAIGEWERAIKLCKDPELVRKARIYLGTCHMQSKQHAEALKQFEQLTAGELSREKAKAGSVDQRRQVLLYTVNCHVVLKNKDKATQLADEFKKEFPNDVKDLEVMLDGKGLPRNTAESVQAAETQLKRK
jgi:tetratricopeptide (TPR) repeat protein